MWGSGVIHPLHSLQLRARNVPPPLRVGVTAEIEVAPATVGNVGVQLGRAEVGVSEHLLDASQICSAFEQVGGEGVAQEVRVHALRLKACAAGEAAQDQECAGAREGAALGVQEQLGPVPL